jgi:hypothetical protein
VRIRNRLLSLLMVAVAAVSVLALAACGGGDDGGGNDGDATSKLSEAFKKPIPKATVAVDISAKVDGVQALTQPVSLKLTGPYESLGKNKVPKLDWDVNLSGGGQAFTGKLISTGDNAFVGFQGQNYEVGTELISQFEQQLAAQRENQGQTLQQLGIDPSTWLSNAKEEGEEDVAGAKTTKITGAVNVEKMLTDINSVVDKVGPSMGQSAPSKLTPEQIKQATDVVKDPKFEVFVAEDDGTVRRLVATVGFEIPEAQRQQAQGATGGEISFTVEFSNVGQPAQVTAPTDARPITELQEQLQGLMGGATGGGSSGSGSSGGGDDGGGASGADSEAFEKYASCVEDAGGDQAKLAECSELLK